MSTQVDDATRAGADSLDVERTVFLAAAARGAEYLRGIRDRRVAPLAATAERPAA